MAQIIKTSKIGVLKIVTLEGVTLAQASEWGFHSSESADGIEIRYSTKSDYAKIVDLVDAANIPVETVATTGTRRIERHDVAVANGLNHGKSWVASGYDVDKNSLNPSWEGISICYVYA